MLTAVVNIAVFAAFRKCCCRRSPAIPELKGICRDWQRDVSCYGRQKRQDRGKNGKIVLPFSAGSVADSRRSMLQTA
jgi:hypothetical protein